MKIIRKVILAALIPIAMCWSLPLQGATVQFEMGGLLNARTVTTVSDGKLVPWTESVEGVDGTGSSEATLEAGKWMGDSVPKALPDDGRFPANARHPEVVLHFSNADATGKQVHRSLAADSFSLAAIRGKYGFLSIFCMSAYGSTSLTVKLIYSDGSEIRNLIVPDYYKPLAAGDTARYYLAQDLAKWNRANQKTEPDHHYLYGLSLSPNPARILTRFEVIKPKPGVLTFWGATGLLPGGATTVRGGTFRGKGSLPAFSPKGTTRNILGRVRDRL